MNIYLVAPLYSSAERPWNDKLAALLGSMGNEVFLPQREATPVWYDATILNICACLRILGVTRPVEMSIAS